MDKPVVIALVCVAAAVCVAATLRPVRTRVRTLLFGDAEGEYQRDLAAYVKKTVASLQARGKVTATAFHSYLTHTHSVCVYARPLASPRLRQC